MQNITMQQVLLSDRNSDVLKNGIYKLKVNYCYVGDSFSVVDGKIPPHIVNKVTEVKKRWGKREPISFVLLEEYND